MRVVVLLALVGAASLVCAASTGALSSTASTGVLSSTASTASTGALSSTASTGALSSTASTGARTREVCLSRADHVTFTLAFPETCVSKKIVLLDHAGQEVLQWVSPCLTDVHQSYKDRVNVSCDDPRCQLQLTLLRLTEADSGQLQCRDGGLEGSVLPDCCLELQVLGLEDLSQVCSYSDVSRTVTCERVTQEVKIYRSGDVSDRDVFYKSGPFSYSVKEHEFGRFVVTRTQPSRQDALCSQDFSFLVAKYTGGSGAETDDRFVIISIILGVFLLVFVSGMDIVYTAICSRGAGRQ